jgi:SAM-dependent methyltransferase
MTGLFFELFSGLPRQGPGDAASTLRALALVPGVGPETRVLDVGCGTGLQTRVLAQHTPARITAIDNHRPYIEELNRHSEALSISDRLDARVGDMRRLDFPSGSFDLVWSEGAICVVGFEAGLREWRRLLAPGGHMAVTEACWTKPNPPRECLEFWMREYPAIRDVPAFLKAVADCGYETVGHFTLPPSSWWEDYYAPLLRNLERFRKVHRDEPDAQELADQVQREIDIWRSYSEFFSYEFFVMRTLDERASI